jgi:hypothetical protein
MSSDVLLQALAKDARVQLVEPLKGYALYTEPQYPYACNDPYASLQRGFIETDAALAHLDAREVQALLPKGSNVSHGMLQVNAPSTIAATCLRQKASAQIFLDVRKNPLLEGASPCPR